MHIGFLATRTSPTPVIGPSSMTQRLVSLIENDRSPGAAALNARMPYPAQVG
jgi:hypothetical protein